MAASSEVAQRKLWALDALKPMAALLAASLACCAAETAGQGADCAASGIGSARVASVAAWAMGNMLDGQWGGVQTCMAIEGFPEAVVQFLRHVGRAVPCGGRAGEAPTCGCAGCGGAACSHDGLARCAAEVAWLTGSLALAGSDTKHAQRLAVLGLTGACAGILTALASLPPSAARSSPLLAPAARAFAAVMSRAAPTALGVLLCPPDAPPVLREGSRLARLASEAGAGTRAAAALLALAAADEAPPAEVVHAIAAVCGAPQGVGFQALLATHLPWAPTLLNLLDRAARRGCITGVRLASLAVANLLAGGSGGTGSQEALAAVLEAAGPAFVARSVALAIEAAPAQGEPTDDVADAPLHLARLAVAAAGKQAAADASVRAALQEALACAAAAGEGARGPSPLLAALVQEVRAVLE
ncbi:unnamed protein product [Pedinophyceae sp. YPF-701]|nr:unnamed protein product [Pedinophyceae sp. YPF-701]